MKEAKDKQQIADDEDDAFGLLLLLQWATTAAGSGLRLAKAIALTAVAMAGRRGEECGSKRFIPLFSASFSSPLNIGGCRQLLFMMMMAL